jgi:CBS domain-containing protein
MSVADVMSLRVVTVRPEDSIREAIGRMLEANVGAVAVCHGGRLEGIFTERDVLRLAGRGEQFGDSPVADVMTTEVITISPDDDILSAARLMRERQIRHLPVLQGENVLGILGIRDVLGTLVERLWQARDAEARDTARELLQRQQLSTELPSSSAVSSPRRGA